MINGSIKFTGRLPSLNTLQGQSWRKRYAEKTRLIQLIRLLMFEAHLDYALAGKWRLTVLVAQKRHIKDPTNIAGGFKDIEDALVTAKFIPGDESKDYDGGQPIITQVLERGGAPTITIERNLLTG